MIHRPADLGAHALGLLDTAEAQALERHLAELAARSATAGALVTARA